MIDPADLSTITEAVRAAVAEAMNGEDERPRRALLTHQALAPEWRLLITFSNGIAVPYDFASEADALARAGRLKHSRWELQHRLVSAWTTVAPPPGPDRRD